MSSESTKPQKSANNLAYAAIAIVVILVLIISGLVYQFLIVPAQIRTSLNYNIEANNRIFEKAEPVVDDIAKKAEAITTSLNSTSESSATTNQKIIDLKAKISDLDSITKDIDSSKSSLDSGNVQETRDFKNLVSDNLESTKIIISDFKNFVEYQSCITQKYLAISEAFEKLAQDFARVNSEDISSVFKGTIYPVGISDNLSSIKSCFVGEYSKYLTPAIDTGLSESVAYINKVNDEFAKLSTSSALTTGEANSDQQFGLINTILSVPSFLTDDDAIKTAIDSPVTDLNQKLSSLEESNKKVNDKLIEIKKKFNL